MKKTTKYLFCILAAFIMLQACDLDPLVDYKEGLPSTQDGTDSGTDGTGTKTAPFALPHSLAVINLPSNTTILDFADVAIGDIGTCKNYTAITMTYENGKATAQIPLTDSAGVPLTRSGLFFLSIKINVDDLTKITISKNDKYQIDLINGSAFFDATKLPQPEIPSPPVVSYLTVINLPQNTLLTDFSDVAIGDAGTCKNYTAITMTYEDGKAKALIPLSGSDGNHFSKTGVFFLSIKINIDDHTKIIISKKDQYEIPFINGNGLFDASRLPQPPPVSYLTVINLPANTIASDFAELSIGDAGTCSDFSAIKVSYADNKATALIPLSDTEGNRFSKTGVFFLSITINIDDHTKIIIAKKDKYEIIFTAGNGLFNASILPQPPPPTEYSAFLTVKNLPDNIIASSFSNVKIGTMATCPNYALISVVNRTALIPLSLTGGAEFKSSGFFYIELTARVDSIAYLQISFANDVIVRFENGNGTLDLNDLFGLNNPGYKEEYIAISAPRGDLLYQYSGNIAVTSLTLPRGVYCFEVAGAGGGGSGWLYTGSYIEREWGNAFPSQPGGAGGKIIELKAFYKPTTIQVFTGEGGGGGNTVRTFYIQKQETAHHTGNDQSADWDEIVTTPGYFYAGAGGGGGSGSFILCESEKYLLCAGGGGGGGSGSGSFSAPDYNWYGFPISDGSLTTHFSGGAGGSLGSGGSGRGIVTKGDLSYAFDYFYSFYHSAEEFGNKYIYSGSGGGIYGGSPSASWGNSGANVGGGNAYGFAGAYAGEAVYFNVEGVSLSSWKNTNNANGNGGTASPGGPGGNNRNATRGNGAPGGPGGGGRSDGLKTPDAGYPGSSGAGGYIKIYKVNS